MTPTDWALAFALAGGAVVAVGVGAIARLLERRFDRFAEISVQAAEMRAYIAARIEIALDRVAHATLVAEETRNALEIDRRAVDRATDARALADRHARSLRLRAARARSFDWRVSRRPTRSGRR